MKTAKLRNLAFVEMIRNTKNTTFGTRLLILSAFASGAGCVFMFDEDNFELWSNSSPSSKKVCSVSRAK